MVKHIVMWKLKDSAEGNSKEENANIIKRKLEALSDKIEEIEGIEVGLDFNGSEMAYDVALYSEFANREALDTYQKHPDHLEAAGFVRSVVQARVVVDYEI